MKNMGYTLFDTAIGRCGIAWSTRGITCVLLPEADEALTRARLERHAAEAAAPPEIEVVICAIASLLRGEPTDLSFAVLDMDGVPSFERRVYEVARNIPPGATLTYGEIAARVGLPRAAQAVGQALGRNPFPIIVPCHRVVAAGGRLGGFSAHGGRTTKAKLLAIEGAKVQLSLEMFSPTT